MSWKNHSAGLDPSYAVSNFQFRFHLVTDSEVNLSGWYLDDVRLQAGECLPMAGGLVVGNVYDADANQPLVGARSRTRAVSPLSPQPPKTQPLTSPSTCCTLRAV